MLLKKTAGVVAGKLLLEISTHGRKDDDKTAKSIPY